MKKTFAYVPKLIVNGTEVSTTAKQVTFKIKDSDVTVNCTYISAVELEGAYTSTFAIKAQDRNIEVHYAKCENRVSASVYINSVLAFSSLSIQAVFTVLNTAYGLSKSTLNNLYVKSNTTRKQSSKSVNSVVVESSFEY